MEPTGVDIGAIVRQRRQDLGMSQRILAANTALSPQYINDLERGRRSCPPNHVLDALTQALALPSAYLYLLVGRLPPGTVIPPDPNRVVAAFEAMRAALR